MFSAVQHERAPRTNQYKHSTNEEIRSKTLKRKQGNFEHSNQDITTNATHVTPKKEKVLDSPTTPEPGYYGNSPPRFLVGYVTPENPKGGAETVAMTAVITPPHTPQHRQQMPFQMIYLSSPEMLHESAVRILFMTVKWVRNIPTFFELPFRDQAILLEEGWSELFILSIAQWNLPVEISTLMAAAGVSPQPSESVERVICGMAEIKALKNIVERFRAADIDQTEYACLKAVVLFKPGLCLSSYHCSLLGHILINSLDFLERQC